MNSTAWMRRLGALALAVGAMAGCTGGCNQEENKNPTGPSPAATSTPTPVVIVHDTYTGSILPFSNANSVNCTGTYNGADGSPANGCLSISGSPSSDTFDHFRRDLSTSATAVTTEFRYDFVNLAGPLSNTVEVRLELDNVTRWRFEVANNGGSILFNGSAISCGACGTQTVWHTVKVVSSGTTTSQLTVDGSNVAAFTANVDNPAADDAIDKLHLKMSEAMRGAGAIFQFDEFKLTTP